jgi:hypothetical protein
MLRSGGRMVNTVDFRDGGEVYIPQTHVRFYDAERLQRIYKTYNSLDESLCDWSGAKNNFYYNNTAYTFATLLLVK